MSRIGVYIDLALLKQNLSGHHAMESKASKLECFSSALPRRVKEMGCKIEAVDIGSFPAQSWDGGVFGITHIISPGVLKFMIDSTA